MFSTDAWLSGFIDGEGCFTQCSSVRRKDGTRKFYPRFRIGLREDDKPILEALQREFGGSVSLHQRGDDAFGRKASYAWIVSGESLERLIAYLDRFPLRAKKAQQFAAWRERFSL